MKSYEAICQELDSLTVAYLNKLNEYTQQWKGTSDQFQQGYLQLAHAKYTMGDRTISHYSYDERMKALLQVEIDDSQEIHARRKAATDSPKKIEKKNNSALDPEKDGLRKRDLQEPKKKNSEWVQVVENGSPNSDKDGIELDEKKNQKKIKKSGDPLHWFGLFVSSSLRSSQEHFKSASDQLINQVNRINELKALEKRYHELEQEKLSIKLKQTSIKEDVTA